MTPGRPAAVTRYERRPLWWLIGALLFVAVAAADDVQNSRQAAAADEGHVLVVGVAGRDYHGGASVPVRYTHPVTHQQLDLDVTVHRASQRPAAGAPVTLVVSNANPGRVRVAGDHESATQHLLENLALAVVPFLVWVRRRWHRWRVERTMASAKPSFAMLGALGPPRRWGRRPLLSLYPLDAGPGTSPVCSVPLLVTTGAPFATLLEVEVKGTPRSYGRVVARRDGILWPTGRATGRSGILRPDRGVTTDVSFPAVTTGITPPSWRVWVRTQAVEAITIAASLALIALVTTVTLINAHRAHTLEHGGTPVVTTVEHRGESTVAIRYPSPDNGTTVSTTAPVDYPEDYVIGRRYPARVAPDDAHRVRLDAEPYDTFEPIAWAALPLLIALIFAIRSALGFRFARRAAAQAPTRRYDARIAHVGKRTTELEIGSFEEPGARCFLPVPHTELRQILGTPDVLVRGTPAPGEALAISLDGRTLTVLGPAGSPRRDQRPQP